MKAPLISGSPHHGLIRAISILLSSLKLVQHFLETTTLVGAQAILLNFSPLKKKKKNTDNKEK